MDVKASKSMMKPEKSLLFSVREPEGLRETLAKMTDTRSNMFTIMSPVKLR